MLKFFTPARIVIYSIFLCLWAGVFWWENRFARESISLEATLLRTKRHNRSIRLIFRTLPTPTQKSFVGEVQGSILQSLGQWNRGHRFRIRYKQSTGATSIDHPLHLYALTFVFLFSLVFFPILAMIAYQYGKRKRPSNPWKPRKSCNPTTNSIQNQ